MATKKQLETELADLRKQLAARPPASGGIANAEPEETEPSGGAPAGDAAVIAGSDFEATDWEAQIREVLEELEDLPQKKPLLFALGAFALGYLIGRSR